VILADLSLVSSSNKDFFQEHGEPIMGDVDAYSFASTFGSFVDFIGGSYYQVWNLEDVAFNDVEGGEEYDDD